MRISDWSSDVCSSDLDDLPLRGEQLQQRREQDRAGAVGGQVQFHRVVLPRPSVEQARNLRRAAAFDQAPVHAAGGGGGGQQRIHLPLVPDGLAANHSSEGRRAGYGWVNTCLSPGSSLHEKKKNHTIK